MARECPVTGQVPRRTRRAYRPVAKAEDRPRNAGPFDPLCVESPHFTRNIRELIGNTARIVCAAILRLPRPHLPLASTTTNHAPLDEDTLQGADLTRPTPFFRRHVYSDSDDEDSYTAMDRDARLVYAV